MHMLGNTSYYLIRKLNAFGTFPTTASSLVLGLNITMELVPNILERPLHTGTIFDTPCNTVLASSEVSIKIDGALSVDYYPFFESWLGKTMTNNIETAVNPTGSVSLTIMLLDSQNPTRCRYALGCTVKSINLTAAPKDYIKMSIELVGKSLSDWTTRPSISESYPTGPTCHKPIKFADFRHGYFSNISNYTMTLDSEFVLDSVRYSNNDTPTNNTFVKKMITLTILTVFNPSLTDQVISAINELIDTYYVSFSSNIVVGGNAYLMGYTRPDPANGVWKSNYNTKFVYNAGSKPTIKINY